MEQKLIEKCKAYCLHFTGLTGIESAIIDISGEPRMQRITEKRFCDCCLFEKKDELATHTYGCNESFRWNGKYIYYCPIGLVFINSAIVDKKGSLVGAMLMGPILMGDLEDMVGEKKYESMKELFKTLPALNTDQVRNLSELLHAVSLQILASEGYLPLKFSYDQSELLDTMHDMMKKYRNQQGKPLYPIEAENKLKQMIIMGDKDASRKLLNELLGDVYFCTGLVEIEEIKGRVMELVAVVSRTVIAAGADPRQIFGFNDSNIRAIDEMKDMEELNFWLNGIIHRFISSTLDLAVAKHSDAIHKVINYIRNNYQNKISLTEISDYVFLSKSYLSTTFKEEMGLSITDYINKFRIEKSKALLTESEMTLIEIALFCGFEDQSYFTKIFKKVTGVSPKKYRETKDAK